MSALLATDRCDRCGAQARLSYTINGLTLLMCQHHDREYGTAMLAKGAVLTVDEKLVSR